MDKIKSSFLQTFWNTKRGYLCDYVINDYKDWSIRPNMLISAALPYRAIDEDICKSIIDLVQCTLLTPRGIRTLSPDHADYQGIYEGNQESRDLAYHQGTAYPWLLGPFIEAYLLLHGKSGVSFVEKLIYEFEEEMRNHGIGTVSEIYNGNPPHVGAGAVSQAWNVAELLRAMQLVTNIKNATK
jgi:glycogen debranching enzyme